MFQRKIFIFKVLRAPFVYAHGASPVPVQKVAALNHKVLDDPVKGSTFEADGSAAEPEFPRAELPEVLSRPRHHIRKQLHFNAPGWETPDRDVEKNHWVVRMPQTILR
jgi:hypothetical protein